MLIDHSFRTGDKSPRAKRDTEYSFYQKEIRKQNQARTIIEAL
jgi:hypothetical protein